MATTKERAAGMKGSVQLDTFNWAHRPARALRGQYSGPTVDAPEWAAPMERYAPCRVSPERRARGLSLGISGERQ